jgi:hypothetical protein
MTPAERWELLEGKIKEALQWVEQMRSEQEIIAKEVEAEKDAMLAKAEAMDMILAKMKH